MTDKEKSVMEAMYYKILAIENVLILKNITTSAELIMIAIEIREYLERKEHASQDIPTETTTGREYQSPVHPPNKQTYKKRRRRL